jgi:putative endonuclease
VAQRRSREDRSSKRALGLAGEGEAAAHLERCGYRLVARNARAGGVEIDVVAERAGVVVFVEVKTRRSRRLGAPELAVDARKQARLAQGAAAWLREHRPRARRARFDVITCEPAGDGGWRITHIESAFEAG